jgi:two-component system chemotaxis sensor kinase CheA
MDIHDEMLTKAFVVESGENLSLMEEALIALEAEPADQSLVQTIFRVAHTLKGSANILGFEALIQFSHMLEDVLQGVRDGAVPVTAKLTTLMLQSVDALRQMVAEAAGGTDELHPEHKVLLDELRKAGTVRRNRSRRQNPAAKEGTSDAEEETGSVVTRENGGGNDLRSRSHGTVRVDIGTLDQILNLTGEIAITRGRLTQLLEGGDPESWRDGLEAHREGDRLYMDLQELVMKARMVPLGPTFRQYARTVRDTATAHGRRAELVIEGADVEVDMRMVEHLTDPLTHMVRNALHHGVEPVRQRKALGKPPAGRVTLRAYHEGGSVVIQVADDGAGLNRDAIITRARALGRVSDIETVSDQDLYRLIFTPGLSTVERVTELSGRGVGMDVVRRNIETLRGSIGIQSREGVGTTITIRVPLTLAIIDGLSVGVAGQTYIIPLEAVIECVELTGDERRGETGHGVINLRGKALPYARLRDLFDLDGARGARENIVIVKHGGGQAGLAVDVLYGEQQTVIKPLGKMFQGLPGVAGSAIMGSGRVALILDLPSLLAQVDRTGGNGKGAKTASGTMEGSTRGIGGIGSVKKPTGKVTGVTATGKCATTDRTE